VQTVSSSSRILHQHFPMPPPISENYQQAKVTRVGGFVVYGWPLWQLVGFVRWFEGV